MDSPKNGKKLYHFPQLHRGDCFYDILSRFHEESGHFSSMATSKELFESCPDLRATVVLPYRAGLISSWLGPSANITQELLRDRHSSWQYIRISQEFDDEALEPIIRADIMPGRRKQTRMRRAVQNQLTHLRYCPLCIVEDFIKEGEPFWHQLHQIFGVAYCPVHEIPLSYSNVSLEKRLAHFIAASTLLASSSIEELESQAEANAGCSPYKESYVKLARTVSWLLEHGLELTKTGIVEGYRRFLEKEQEEPLEGRELLNVLRSTFKMGFLQHLLGPDTDGFVIMFQEGHLPPIPPLAHALLITAFGGAEKWGDFLEHSA